MYLRSVRGFIWKIAAINQFAFLGTAVINRVIHLLTAPNFSQG